VSIDPILAVPGIREAVRDSDQSKQVIGISPIIQGSTLKGPAAKMFLEMGIEPSAANVAEHYGSITGGGLLSGFVIDDLDADERPAIVELGISTNITNTIMKTANDRINLAAEVIRIGKVLLG
jgi:LPPG:FO 2-phospho-L-lactate transferase